MDKMEGTMLKTNGLCFICLESVTSENNFISLKRILHHLDISNSVEVEMCESCKKIPARLSTLFLTLEKVQMEISYYLNQTHERIVLSANNLKLVQRYSSRMASDAESLCQLVQVDQLRKELSIKCRNDPRWPELKLTRITNTKQVVSKAKSEADSEDGEAPGDSFPPTDSPDWNFQQISPPPPISSAVDNLKTKEALPPVKHKKDARSFHIQNVFLKKKADLEKSQCKRTASRLSTKTEGVVVKTEAEETPEVTLPPDSKKLHTKLEEFTVKKAESGTLVTCTICFKQFQNKLYLEEHLIRIHRPFVKTPKFQCDTCGAAFTQKKSLENHIFLLHLRGTEQKPCRKKSRKYFQCEICKRMISDSRRNLKVHMRIHTGEKPYKCDLCGMAFSIAGSLRDHNACKHSNVTKPFVCGLCGKSFIRPYLLDYHRHKVHNVSKGVGSCSSVTPSLFNS